MRSTFSGSRASRGLGLLHRHARSGRLERQHRTRPGIRPNRLRTPTRRTRFESGRNPCGPNGSVDRSLGNGVHQLAVPAALWPLGTSIADQAFGLAHTRRLDSQGAALPPNDLRSVTFECAGPTTSRSVIASAESVHAGSVGGRSGHLWRVVRSAVAAAIVDEDRKRGRDRRSDGLVGEATIPERAAPGFWSSQ